MPVEECDCELFVNESLDSRRARYGKEFTPLLLDTTVVVCSLIQRSLIRRSSMHAE
jgi:hypothetical protein